VNEPIIDPASTDGTGKKAPAFQFYARDYLADINVRAMTYEQRGVYVELLALCWLERGLPSNLGTLSRILGMKRSRLEKIWPPIFSCFHTEGDRLQHRRLNTQRVELEAYRAKQSQNGKAGADARWHGGANGGGMATLMANNSSASASASAPASASAQSAERHYEEQQSRGWQCGSRSVSAKQHAAITKKAPQRLLVAFDWGQFYASAGRHYDANGWPENLLNDLDRRLRAALEPPDNIPNARETRLLYLVDDKELTPEEQEEKRRILERRCGTRAGRTRAAAN
jgi:uncharacterized protein YdaU (DUF1376 family)